MTKRIYFVDFARSFAIVLALFDHSMNDFQVWHNYEFSTYAVFKTFTSSATPTFLFLFGMMLYIIYLRRLKKYGFRAIAPQLILRSFQCFIGYLVTVLAGLLGGVLTVKNAFAAAIFLGNAHFGNILKLYTLMLLLAVPLLWLCDKKGVNKTLLIILSFWVAYPLLKLIPPMHDNLDILTSYLFGFGGKAGPSIMQGLTIVGVGMYIASKISFEDKSKFYKTSIALLITLVTVICVFVWYATPEVFFKQFTSNFYRRENNPIYYAVGISLALIMTLLFSLMIPIGTMISKKVDYFLVFGRSSLLSFTLGNIFLNLSKVEMDKHSWNIAAPICFVLLMFIILKLHENYIDRRSYGLKVDLALRKIALNFRLLYIRPFSNWMSSRLGD